MFGSRAIDLGTLVLLKEAPRPRRRGDLLDLGRATARSPSRWRAGRRRRRVWAVDVNERALELTRANAEAAKTPNVVACSRRGARTEVRFAAIYSNPPVRVGKAPLHDCS